MKLINNFNQFTKIYEMTEFNLQRMNPDAGGMMPNVDNPQLSVNNFDRHEDAIRAATAKLSGLLNALSNTAQFGALKSRLSLEDQNISSMKIIRITKIDSVKYDVYVSFVIKDSEYWGKIEDILGNAEFKSEVFKNSQELTLTKEWVIKIKGMIIKIVENWLKPEDGEYTQVNDEVYATDVNTGKIIKLEKGSKVKVLRAFDNKIILIYNNNYCQLTGDNFIYFNYWFVKPN